MNYHITLLEGDGIGPEVIGAAVKILEAAQKSLDNNGSMIKID